MGSYGHAQILGFSEDVSKVVDKERKALGNMGTDADRILGQLKEQYEQVAALNAQQEALKRQLKATTAQYMAARVKLYVSCSGALDTTMPAAKNLQRLRSRIRRQRGPTEATILPVPAPAS